MPHYFFGLMGISAALTLVRGFVVALLLPVQDFGVYAVLVAVGAFSSSLLGLGQIEGTMKAFPRAWGDGLGRQVCEASDQLVRAILFRAVPAALISAAVVYFLDLASWGGKVLLVAGVAIGTAAMGVYASVLRASGNLKLLGHTSFSRSLLALLLCSGGAFILGWSGAVIGEVLAAFLGALQARRSGRLLVDWVRDDRQQAKGSGLLESGTLAGGRWLLLAMLAVSIPFYLDRFFVVSILGTEAAGQYAFLMLFIAGASTVSGIIVQKVGPDLVKAFQMGLGYSYQWRIALRWMAGHVAFVAFGVSLAGLMLLSGPLTFVGERYQLKVSHVAAAMMLAVMQCSVILDWILLSRDRERLVFVAAFVYLTLTIALAFWFVFVASDDSLLVLMCGIIMAKLGHILFLFTMVCLSHRTDGR